MLRETLAGSPDETVTPVCGLGHVFAISYGGRQRPRRKFGRQRPTTLTRKGAEVNAFAVWHGEAPWSLSRQHTGTTEIPLTGSGRRLAERMPAGAPRTDAWARSLQPDA